MPPQSDFKISFSIDLKPFASGLETMLAMTQSAGKQIQPLLNLQVNAPDMTAINAQLEQYQETLSQTARAQAEVSGANAAGVPTFDQLDKKVQTATVTTDKHSESIRGMRREFIHVFGAIAFMVTSLGEMAGSMGLGSEGLKKLTSGLERGVSAGFGLASTLSILQIAQGGTAVGIGALVAVGMSLLSFFDNSEEKARASAKALDEFSKSLRGVTVSGLEGERNALQAEIVRLEKSSREAADRRRKSFAQDIIGSMVLGALGNFSSSGVQGFIEANDEKVKQLQAQLDALNKEEENKQLTHAQVLEKIRDYGIKSIQGQYAQRRAAAAEDLRKEEEEIKSSTATEETKATAITAARKANAVKIKQINADEQKDQEEHEKQLITIQSDTGKILIDMAEKKDLASAHGELEKIAITEKYALLRLDVEEKAAIRSLEIERDRLKKLGGEENVRKSAQITELIKSTQEEYTAKRSEVRIESNVKVGELPIGAIANQQEQVKALTDKFNKAVTESDRAALKEQLDLAKQKYDEMVNAYPAGSILDQQEKVKQAEFAVQRATTDGARKAAEEKLRIEKERLEQMNLSEEDFFRREKAREEERIRMWEETHKAFMAMFASFEEGLNTLTQSLMEMSTASYQRDQQMREVDYRLYQLDQSKRLLSLQEELNKGTITAQEYHLTLQKMNLEQAKQEEDIANSRKNAIERAYDSAKTFAVKTIEDLVKEEIKQNIIKLLSHATTETTKTALTIGGSAMRSASAIGESISTNVAKVSELPVHTTIEAAKTSVTEAGVATRNESILSEIAQELASAAASMVKAVASAVEWEISTFGPFAIATLPATIAAMYAIFEGMKHVLGFQSGGRLKKGQPGFFEGTDDEIVMPEKDFKTIAREDLIPQVLIGLQGQKPGKTSGGVSILANMIEKQAEYNKI
jgi:hypothetical protein